MVNTSHARCRQCGQARHKMARFNLCQRCWEEVKPSVRERWKQIKERRALRRAVDAHVAEVMRAPALEEDTLHVSESSNGIIGHQDDLQAQIDSGQLPDDKVAEAIDYIKAKNNGRIPPLGTRERGIYMRLHSRMPRKIWSLSEEQEHEIIRLYKDPSIPLKEIVQAYGSTDLTMIYRVLDKHGEPHNRLAAQRQPPPPQLSLPGDDARRKAATAALFGPAVPPASPPPVPAPNVEAAARQWAITFVPTARTETVAAASFDAAVAQIRDLFGVDVDIISVTRT